MYATFCSAVHIDATVIHFNVAGSRGAGLATQQVCPVTASSVMFGNNSATKAGAVYVSTGSTLNMKTSIVAANNATESGGGLMVDGTRSVSSTGATLSGTLISSNSAHSGGGMSCVQGASVAVSRVSISRNSAHQGAGVLTDAVSSLSVNTAVIGMNIATAAGGGLYVAGLFLSPTPPNEGTPDTTVALSWDHVSIVHNGAVAGGGLYFQLRLPFRGSKAQLPLPTCDNCLAAENRGRDVATSGVSIRLMPVESPVSQVVVSSGMSFSEGIPNVHERPQGAILDVLDVPAGLDNVTRCTIAITSSTDDRAYSSPVSVTAAAGLLSFDNHELRANVGSTAHVLTTCVASLGLSGSFQSTIGFNATIVPCFPSWELTPDRICKRCLAGSYSPFGELCLPCPDGGLCEATEGSGTNEVCIR